MKVKPNRVRKTKEGWVDYGDTTGIPIRAQDPDGVWGTFDIASLDKESLLTWLKGDGGDNELAEDTVGVLLGHGHLND